MGIDGIEELKPCSEVKPMSLTETYNLQRLLDTMKVPEDRKTDLEWLGRNLGFKNKNHPKFDEAMMLLKRLKR